MYKNSKFILRLKMLHKAKINTCDNNYKCTNYHVCLEGPFLLAEYGDDTAVAVPNCAKLKYCYNLS